jgi:type IV pilus assembly protein PilN
MIRINLLAVERGKAKKKSTLDSGQQVLMGCGVILVLAAGGMGWRYLSLASESNRVNADLLKEQAEQKRLAVIIAQVQRLEAQRTLADQRVKLIKQLRQDNTGPVHMLDEISRALPDRLWLTEIKQATPKPDNPGVVDVAMEGNVTNLTRLSDFIANLQSSGYFKRETEIISTLTGPAPAGFISDGDVSKFNIRAQFQQPGAIQPAAPATAPAAAQPARPGGRAGG